jgi:hypothetical protein
MAYFSHIIQPFVTVTASSNTHTIDLDKSGNNYKITPTNATNQIVFNNLDATRIGKAGTIMITNPASVGSLGWSALPSTAYTPGGSTINFDTTANAIAVLTYLVVASNKILVNYVGAFDSYPQP